MEVKSDCVPDPIYSLSATLNEIFSNFPTDWSNLVMESAKDPEPPVSAFCFASCPFNRSASFCLRALPPSYTLSAVYPPRKLQAILPTTKPSPGIGISA